MKLIQWQHLKSRYLFFLNQKKNHQKHFYSNVILQAGRAGVGHNNSNDSLTQANQEKQSLINSLEEQLQLLERQHEVSELCIQYIYRY